jgi:hypothetical protein
MTLTLTNIPSDVESALRRRAQEEGRTLDEVVLRLLIEAADVRPVTPSDFNDIAGTWISDPDVEAALAAQDRIDPGLWD